MVVRALRGGQHLARAQLDLVLDLHGGILLELKNRSLCSLPRQLLLSRRRWRLAALDLHVRGRLLDRRLRRLARLHVRGGLVRQLDGLLSLFCGLLLGRGQLDFMQIVLIWHVLRRAKLHLVLSLRRGQLDNVSRRKFVLGLCSRLLL